jgi:hypothetical protein
VSCELCVHAHVDHCRRCDPASFDAAVVKFKAGAEIRSLIPSRAITFDKCRACDVCGAKRARWDGFCGHCGRAPRSLAELYVSYQLA